MKRKLSPWCKRVKKTLIEKDMSVSDLAKQISRSRGTVSAIVNGRMYSTTTRQLISDCLGIPYSEESL